MEFGIHVAVLTLEQLNTVIGFESSAISRIYVDAGLALNNINVISAIKDKDIYLSFPYVLRKNDISKLSSLLESGSFKGVLIRNLESFAYLNENYDKYRDFNIVLDSNMYILNIDSLLFYRENSKFEIKEYYSSYELNSKEQEQLNRSIGESLGKDIIHSSVVYGRIPMMVSANCINKTMEKCSHKPGFVLIKDRYNKAFSIHTNCEFCYNVIYNCVPLSLHNYFKNLKSLGNLRLDFTDENSDETQNTVLYFASLSESERKPDYSEYTTGHYKRGVE